MTLVGVSPPEALGRRSSLFAALGPATGVDVEPRAPGAWAGLDALVWLGPGAPAAPGLPCLVFAGERGPPPAGDRRCRLEGGEDLDRALRGRVLEERRAALATVRPGPGDAVLATRAGRPAWIRGLRDGHAYHVVGCAADELAPAEVLRDALAPGRFLGLLPLVQFLRELPDTRRPPARPLRAHVLFDDPNLHWTSYGHLRLGALAAHARERGYHVAFATVPLDGFWAHPRATRLFRERRAELSLLVHGVDHEGPELLRPRPEAELERLLAQGLRRVAAFERRTGVRVDRVMTPPHGVCSHESLTAMLRLGFEAAFAFWAFPQPPGRAPSGWALAGWEPAQLLGGGLPVFRRHPLRGHPLEELVFRAFLGHPLILYGHHDDVADGLGRVDEVVGYVQGLGDVEWGSAQDVCAGAFEAERDGATMRVRLFARRIRLEVPDGCERLVVELPAVHGPEQEHRVLAGDAAATVRTSPRAGAAVELPVAPGPLGLRLVAATALDPERVPPPPRRLRPVARRVATEARDRLAPAMLRVSSRRGG